MLIDFLGKIEQIIVHPEGDVCHIVIAFGPVPYSLVLGQYLWMIWEASCLGQRRPVRDALTHGLVTDQRRIHTRPSHGPETH